MFAACVGEQAIEAPGDMLEMEADGCRAAGFEPELGCAQALDRSGDVMGGLHECVNFGGDFRRNAGNRTVEPEFGHVVLLAGE